VNADMLNRYIPNLHCPEHQVKLKDSGYYFECIIDDCNYRVASSADMLDCLMEKSSDQWDNAFTVDENISFVKKSFDGLVRWLSRKVIIGLAFDHIVNNYSSGAELIEMGCGEASASIKLLESKKYNIVLVDKNDNVLQLLRQKIGDGVIGRSCSILKADWYENKLPFISNQFDIAYNVGTIEHFDNPVRAVAEMKRISRQVLCVVPAPSLYWKLSTYVRRVIEKDASLWTDNTRYYTRKELENIFKKAGLVNVKTMQSRLFGLPVMNCIVGMVN
jgi:SAM-dependent methyltransferase